MGFHKRYVPDLKELKEQHASMAEADFVIIYSKPDALIGSAASLAYLDAFFAKREKAIQEVSSGDTKKKRKG
jgi:hypothetical protein